MATASAIITERAYARIGLLGNPSDGYFGKTIACTIENCHADVMIWESPQLVLEPNAQLDPTSFASLDELAEVAGRDGYYGGLRLLFAACKTFREHCQTEGIRLPTRNFTLRYSTSIPRQVGLGGSSAVVTATVKSLMRFYGLSEADIPLEILPNIVLAVETEELGIPAGLQDRVVQVYGGAVYMDFSKELMERQGYGHYERLNGALLPRLFLAHITDPSFSGKVHHDLKVRYSRGDKQVREAMTRWAGYADRGRRALLAGDREAFGTLMDRNFDLRLRVLGKAGVGKQCLAMVETARGLGHPCKFPGSGGAVVGVFKTEKDLQRLKAAYRGLGCACEEAIPQSGCVA